MYLLSHRGFNLPFSKFPESSRQAFCNCFESGYGVEFDANFTKEGKVVIAHDDNLSRLTVGLDLRRIEDISFKDFKNIKIDNFSFCDIDEMLDLVLEYKKFSALHLKGKFQTKKYIDIIISFLRKRNNIFDYLVVFDLKPLAATYLKKKIPQLSLAASCSHSHDIKRFGGIVGGTLLDMDIVLENKKNYDWVWLDEWDRSDSEGNKDFYNENNFLLLKQSGFKIAIVSPELHLSSPGLLGGETHPDGANEVVLKNRLKQVIKLYPDAVCSDFPGLIKLL